MNIFDPAHYAGVRRPLLEATSLPPWCYTSQAFYDREVERIQLTSWHLVGRVDEIAKPGDYRVFDLCGQSAIIIRGKDAELRAFANTCRHRGTRLLDDCGNRPTIMCPYHAWTYRHDGSLLGCHGMEKTTDFNKGDYGLLPVRLSIWAGFVFVCFSDDTTDLYTWLGDLPRTFLSYRFDEFEVVRRIHYDLDCNWKLYIENAMEDYHTPTVHRSSIGLQETDPLNTTGEWDSIQMEGEGTIAVLAEDETPFPEVANREGIPATCSGFTVIYPTTFFGTTTDCMWWLQTIPLGPRKCRVIHGSCFPSTTVARDDFDAHVGKYYRRWDKSIPEDNAISERQQAGLENEAARPGRLSVHEPVVHTMANWVINRVIDEA